MTLGPLPTPAQCAALANQHLCLLDGLAALHAEASGRGEDRTAAELRALIREAMPRPMTRVDA